MKSVTLVFRCDNGGFALLLPAQWELVCFPSLAGLGQELFIPANGKQTVFGRNSGGCRESEFTVEAVKAKQGAAAGAELL